jgi:hypothetical protein
MKKNILVLVLVLFCFPVRAQNKILISYNPGLSLYNSENSMDVIGDKSILWIPGISVAYEIENLWGQNFHFEYDFVNTRMGAVQEFAWTGSSGPDVLGTTTSDLILSCHNVDIAVYYTIDKWLSVAAGPTLSFVNRSIVIDELPRYSQENLSGTFEDRLSSLCLGVNGSVKMEIPLITASRYVFIFSTAKLRYLHSVWFDARGRNLDNYYQSFLSAQINFGLGYNF